MSMKNFVDIMEWNHTCNKILDEQTELFDFITDIDTKEMDDLYKNYKNEMLINAFL